MGYRPGEDAHTQGGRVLSPDCPRGLAKGGWGDTVTTEQAEEPSLQEDKNHHIVFSFSHHFSSAGKDGGRAEAVCKADTGRLEGHRCKSVLGAGDMNASNHRANHSDSGT